MKPILLKGHERPLTRVRFNREGDLMLTCAKDHKPCLWYSHNGERIGTYNGHSGTVWDCDFNWDSSRVLTGSSDCSAKLWDTKTGRELHSIPHKSGVRCVRFCIGEQMILTVQDNTFSSQPTIFIYNMADGIPEAAPVRAMYNAEHGRINTALWGSLNHSIISCDEKGYLRKWDVEMGKEAAAVQAHKQKINDVQFSKDQTMILTASSDHTCKLWDANDLKLLKTYTSDRPINSASISPLFNQVVIGGGQEAMQVTQTSGKAGHFEADFHHMVYEDFMTCVKGHFGPINSISFSPDGKSYASGAEDGYCRLHHFDKTYFDSSKKYNF